MIQKTFNKSGFEVSRGFRNTTVYRAAPCDLLLTINPNNRKETIDEFRKSEFTYYSGIRLENIYDLEFLIEFPLLLYLEVISDKPVDIAPIEKLHNIRGLQIIEPKNGVDFSNFPHLEVFAGKWNENNKNIDSCRDLRSVMISYFNPKSKDFYELKNIVRLESLQIIRTNIESLEGIETLQDLKYLMLAYASKLHDISDIGQTNLREIEFNCIKNVQDYSYLGAIKYLRKMIIGNCGAINDINWINNLKYLDFFTFVETNILGGDLSPLLQLPELRYVGSFDKKHYNLKMDEIKNHIDRVHPQKHF